jgi:hypothetical protein
VKYKIQVNVLNEVPLAWLVCEALRLHKIRNENTIHDLLDLDLNSLFYGVTSQKNNLPLDLTKIISETFCDKFPILFLLFEGPFKKLNLRTLLVIGSYIGNIKDISALQQSNKTLNYIFMSENIWSRLKLKYSFDGTGILGNADSEWKIFQDLYGLPTFNLLR